VSEASAAAAAVERLSSSLVRRIRREAPELEPALTPTQRVALAVVADEGPLRLGVLADRIGTSDSAATRAVDVLAGHSLVERQPDPADGRAILIAATPAGIARRDEGLARLERALVGTLEHLEPADLARLAELLGRVSAALEANEPSSRSSGS
jgi:DNA-binding MarR family transcriptional regulator